MDAFSQIISIGGIDLPLWIWLVLAFAIGQATG